jgi:hypothetical protein
LEPGVIVFNITKRRIGGWVEEIDGRYYVFVTNGLTWAEMNGSDSKQSAIKYLKGALRV